MPAGIRRRSNRGLVQNRPVELSGSGSGSGQGEVTVGRGRDAVAQRVERLAGDDGTRTNEHHRAGVGALQQETATTTAATAATGLPSHERALAGVAAGGAALGFGTRNDHGAAAPLVDEDRNTALVRVAVLAVARERDAVELVGVQAGGNGEASVELAVWCHRDGAEHLHAYERDRDLAARGPARSPHVDAVRE